MEVPNTQYSRYSLVLGSLFVVLAGLNLLLDGHRVVPYAYPLLIAGVIHVLGIVVHYVFMQSNPDFIGYDISFFIYNLVLAVLLVSNLFFLKWFQPLLALLPVRGARA